MPGRTDNPLVDTHRLSDWMEQIGLGRGSIDQMEPLSGGTQNVLMRFSRNGRDYVIRRPPPKPRPESNETMRREARVLGALQSTGVPHPTLIAACSDEEVLGVAFYLMEPVLGFNAISGLPPLHANTHVIQRRMGFAMAEGAISIANVDIAAVGLVDFGRPDGFLKRQVGRWTSQLSSYHAHAGWPGPAGLPGIDAVVEFLEQGCPASFVPGLMHGDYTMANVMFRPDCGELAAIIDWELATIGDPLIDFAWLLATWQGIEPEEFRLLHVAGVRNLPSASEMIDHYQEHSNRSLEHLDWYFVLACFKLAIILEGTFARACAGKDPMATGEKLHEGARVLMRRAQHRVGQL